MKNLGEQIYSYRTKCGLSQLDIAEKLEVSRQSVSKWENNTAVPELAKLVKLCELFDITLDELVNGADEPTPLQGTWPISSPQAGSNNEAITITIKKPSFQRLKKAADPHLSPKRIAGLCILGVGFLFLLIMNLFVWYSDAFSSFLWGILFLICAAICFFESKHCVLLCLWSVWSFAYTMNGIGLNDPIFAIPVTLLLATITIISFLKTPFALSAKTVKLTIAGALSAVILFFPLKICAARLAHFLLPAIGKIEDSYLAFSLTCLVFDLESLVEICVIAIFVFSIAPLLRIMLNHLTKPKQTYAPTSGFTRD